MRYVAAGVLAMMLLLAIRSCQAEELNLNQPSTADAMKQLGDTADAARRQNERYLEKGRQQETNKLLDDIDDSIRLNGILEDSDE